MTRTAWCASLFALVAGASWLFTLPRGGASEPGTATSADVIVYGGTSGAVTAAVEVRRSGKSVVLISPDKHLGGMTSGGLGWTDLGNPSILGGLSADFYHRVWRHYQSPAAWTQEPAFANKVAVQDIAAVDDANQRMFVFEPKVAEAVFEDWIAENKIPVVRARLDLEAGVRKNGAHLVALRIEDRREFAGKVFIDATYEGDLMAKAGASYTVGREPAARFGETLNGFQGPRALKNQLVAGIDPFVRKGDLASGLLPQVNPAAAPPEGTGDRRVQAYCYRMCLTDAEANRVAIEQPTGYREEDYELLFRAIEAGQAEPFFKVSPLPNHKTDSNNAGGISTDLIGVDDEYPDANYQRRADIAAAHERWQRGLLWTLQNHPRIPAAIRARCARFGLPRDEFVDNGHWSPTLYIREARRLAGDLVLDQRTIENNVPAAMPISLGAYTMDSHNVQRLVSPRGDVQNEGDVQSKVRAPYQIDYRVLTPRRGECDNLLVTFCVSATHIAFGSVRMEPVFMMTSQSAAVAACQAIDDRAAVQDVSYDSLRAKLLTKGQRLSIP